MQAFLTTLLPYDFEQSAHGAGPKDIQHKKEALAKIRRKIILDNTLTHLRTYASRSAYRLLVVPDGLINSVPFSALIYDKGKYIIDRFVDTSEHHTSLVLDQTNT